MTGGGMMRIVCGLCDDRRIVGQIAIDAHVAGHKVVGDVFRVYGAVANGVVLTAWCSRRNDKSADAFRPTERRLRVEPRPDLMLASRGGRRCIGAARRHRC
jgi:hypothetical protein